jgi:hypothetical protein
LPIFFDAGKADREINLVVRFASSASEKNRGAVQRFRVDLFYDARLMGEEGMDDRRAVKFFDFSCS